MKDYFIYLLSKVCLVVSIQLLAIFAAYQSLIWLHIFGVFLFLVALDLFAYSLKKRWESEK